MCQGSSVWDGITFNVLEREYWGGPESQGGYSQQSTNNTRDSDNSITSLSTVLNFPSSIMIFTTPSSSTKKRKYAHRSHQQKENPHILHIYNPPLPLYLTEAIQEPAGCLNVLPIGPNLMFEYVTLAPGLLLSTSAGTPDVTSQVPLGPPGALFVVG